MKIETTIKRIARRVRRWAERNHEQCCLSDESLSCMCAIASVRLFQQLRAAGLEDARVCCATEPDYHAFVKCGGYVIDVTATQFSCEYTAVEIRPIEEAKDDIWKVAVTLRTEQEIRDYFSGWEEDQQPLLLRV
jgi:hypothetical protein